jgi:NAD-reducing hydrogenase large subunit
MTLHCLEVITAVLQQPELMSDQLLSDQLSSQPSAPVQVTETSSEPLSVGVGWSDGARGLLVHRYAVTADQLLAEATILTPTAQNEPWLAHLLARAVGASAAGQVTSAALEAAIRAGDPCLPCTDAPPGAMPLIIDDPLEQASSGSTISLGG